MSTYNKILVCVLISLFAFSTKVKSESIEIVPIPQPPTFEQEMTRIFGDKTKIAYAVIMHESSNNERAKNYNCYYAKIVDGVEKKYSTFCKKGDEHKAWSVDCGIAQINVRGQVCPPYLFTEKGQLAAIERIYKTQGLNAWVSYKTGAYKKFL